jgi:hypothetical protein
MLVFPTTLISYRSELEQLMVLPMIIVILSFVLVVLGIWAESRLMATLTFCKGRYEKRYTFKSGWTKIEKIHPSFKDRERRFGRMGALTNSPSEYNTEIVDIIGNVVKSKNYTFELYQTDLIISVEFLRYFEVFFIVYKV